MGVASYPVKRSSRPHAERPCESHHKARDPRQRATCTRVLPGRSQTLHPVNLVCKSFLQVLGADAPGHAERADSGNHAAWPAGGGVRRVEAGSGSSAAAPTPERETKRAGRRRCGRAARPPRRCGRVPGAGIRWEKAPAARDSLPHQPGTPKRMRDLASCFLLTSASRPRCWAARESSRRFV